MLVALLVSFLGTCGSMFYLLYRQRSSSLSTVSHHAASTHLSHIIFISGHFVGGIAFLVFAYNFFYIQDDVTPLFVVSIIAVVFEQLQALVPNRSGLDKLHTSFAAAMAALMIIIVLLAPFYIPISTTAFATYIFTGLLVLVSGTYGFLNRSKFFRSQMVFFSTFYIFMLLLYFGGT